MYITPQDAVRYLIDTGDKRYLKMVDPARRDELKKCLVVAQQALLQKSKAKSRKPAVHPLRKGVEPWHSGDSYADIFGWYGRKKST